MEPTSGQAPASLGAPPSSAGSADGVEANTGLAGSAKQKLPEVAVSADYLYSEESDLKGLRVKVRPLSWLHADDSFVDDTPTKVLTQCCGQDSAVCCDQAAAAAQRAAACLAGRMCVAEQRSSCASDAVLETHVAV
jgi:hypothetical protein